ncbi:hypothetical protein NDI54_07565 [Haloarcula sp. S1AR25-5A]|uniref:Uncharacterized protein n=1 Tax=Haloarcula terrestris TaxID=2950533 RepID=A0AAE4EWF0_9EURY|nr:hypothetical protein [Haloarcula terrestris]MDS0221202.1 hypothetical protein [Haloarcula terrestris]
MERPTERGGKEQSSTSPSFGHLLLVWLFVGPSLWSLGSAVAAAIQAELPLSTMGTGLLFGTVVVVLFWTAGFHPSLRASFGYFLAEQGIYLVLVVGIATAFAPAFTSWVAVAVQLVSISLAATLVFSPVGAKIRNWFRRHIRSLLKLPPQDRAANRE